MGPMFIERDVRTDQALRNPCRGVHMTREGAMTRTWGLLFSVLFLPALCQAGGVLEGRHCLSFGDQRSLQEARLLVHTLAIRNAVETAGILDGLPHDGSACLYNDVFQVLLSGFLQDVQVQEHEETDRTVCETVLVHADPDDLRAAVREAVVSRNRRLEERGVARNACLKVLAVNEAEDRYGRCVEAVVRVMRATGPLYTAELRSQKPCFKVCIEYLGPGGVPAEGDALFVDTSVEGLVEGEVRTLRYYAPEGIQSYRIWLPGESDFSPAEPVAAPARATPSALSAEPENDPIRELEGVDATSTDRDGFRVEVLAHGPIERHRHFFMGDPPRLVIDLPGRWDTPRFHARRVESRMVERIRIGRHPDKLRLVLDLRPEVRDPAAVIRESSRGLAIVLPDRP